MPKVISSAVAEHLAGEVMTFATCRKITLLGGIVQGFTDHVRDLEVDGVTYKMASGYTDIRTAANLAFDNPDIDSVFSDDGGPPDASLPFLHPSSLCDCHAQESHRRHAGASRFGDDAPCGDLADHAQGRRAFFFTDHDRDIVFGGEVYRAAAGFERTAIRSDAGFAVDNLDLVGVFAEGGIVEDEVRAGLFDGAGIAISFVSWQDPRRPRRDQAAARHAGRDAAHAQGYFTAELRGLSQALTQKTLQMYGPDCRADLGDSRCKFPLWPGVVARGTAYAAGQFVRASNTGGTNASDFDDRIYECTTAGTTHATLQPTYEVTVGNTTTDGTAVFTAREGFTRASEVALVDNDRELDADAALDAYADGWFDKGLLVFESGANAGAAYEVKRWTQATRRLELWSAARLHVEVGDRFRISPGCHKRVIEDCRDKFRIPGSLLFADGNARNFRGEPYMPGSVFEAPA